MTYQNILVDGIMHLGDMIMTASVFPVLQKNCPGAKITYLASGNLAFAAKLFDGVDEVIPYTYKSKGGYLDVYRMGRTLARKQFDLGISLDPRERVTLMKWFAHIPERLSMEQALGWQLGWEKYFYTKDLTLPECWHYREHSMASSFQQMLRLYFEDPETEFIAPRLKPLAPEIEKWAVQCLAQYGQGGKNIALCIQTTSGTKDWPPEQFARLCDWLVEQYGATLYLTGISTHRKRADAMKRALHYPAHLVDLVGKTSFMQLVALLRHMDALVTLDTGTAHIGAIAGCPVVTLFSYISPEIYKAPGKYAKCVSGHLPCSGKHICIGPNRCPKMDCVDAIHLEMVQDAVKKLLQEAR